MPQLLSNYLRKSTDGWNIILDLIWGTFTLAQNLIDSLNGESVIIYPHQNKSLDIAKFALSIWSIFLGIIFLIQHFILYNKQSNTNKLYVAAFNDS